MEAGSGAVWGRDRGVIELQQRYRAVAMMQRQSLGYAEVIGRAVERGRCPLPGCREATTCCADCCARVSVSVGVDPHCGRFDDRHRNSGRIVVGDDAGFRSW